MRDENLLSKIVAMRTLTEWTGQVSENQLKTLRLWPMALIPGIKKHTAKIHTEERKVEYSIVLKPKHSLSDTSTLSQIEVGVWAILGDTWYTVFKVNGKTVYEGKRRKELKNGQDNQLGSGRKGFES